MAKDPNEILPFCMRCHNVGVVCDDNGGFCHQCGSEGTCIPMKRSDINYLNECINARMGESNALVPVKDAIMYLSLFKEAIDESQEKISQSAREASSHVISLIIKSFKDYRNGIKLPGTAEKDLDADLLVEQEDKDKDNRYEGIL